MSLQNTFQDHSVLYDTLWRYIEAEGRRDALFGERCTDLARQAFRSCAAGSVMPIIYLEIPLVGEPRFDLQVCIERTALAEDIAVPQDAPPAEADLLAWLAGPNGADCIGVDLAFDISAGDVSSPQLITLMRNGTLEDAEGFFALTGAPSGAARYRAADQRVPAGWRSWYAGAIPQREGSPVRLDYFVDDATKQSYTQDVSLLKNDLSQMGYGLSDCACGWCRELLTLPGRLNLQLDLREDGSIGPVLGYNLIESGLGPRKTKARLQNGWMRQVLELAEEWGLADCRWQRLEELCLGLGLVLRNDLGERTWAILNVKPTFIKIRMAPDALVDAKVYVIATLTLRD